jgi:hypothetical protein
MNFKRLALTDITVEIPRLASKKVLTEAYTAAGAKKWMPTGAELAWPRWQLTVAGSACHVPVTRSGWVKGGCSVAGQAWSKQLQLGAYVEKAATAD